MIEALEREVGREEKLRAFVREAMAAGKAIDAGAEVYRVEDVQAWLDRLARDPHTARPKAWRK